MVPRSLSSGLQPLLGSCQFYLHLGSAALRSMCPEQHSLEADSGGFQRVAHVSDSVHTGPSWTPIFFLGVCNL